ncbi:hypothetical protein B0J11DRAFT_511870 [Dendryphion nanum]|uniref:Uncharacterized protein n=1 Tax=Dendryphion nanum TaxID=256645 RepID=A0A9P9D3L0_9PLEO|nr:hypothetical protein B0J11DRAFT_511870 [Dendryphion nanum]
MQCVFVCMPLSYSNYAASLFAGIDFVRSAFACGSVLFGRPLFVNRGIGEGVYGAKLRSKSKFAMADAGNTLRGCVGRENSAISDDREVHEHDERKETHASFEDGVVAGELEEDQDHEDTSASGDENGENLLMSYEDEKDARAAEEANGLSGMPLLGYTTEGHGHDAENEGLLW